MGDDDAPSLPSCLERRRSRACRSASGGGAHASARPQKLANYPAFLVETANLPVRADAGTAGFILVQNKGCALEDCIRAGSPLAPSTPRAMPPAVSSHRRPTPASSSWKI